MEYINIFCGQNAEFWRVKAGDIYNNHWAFNGFITISVSSHIIQPAVKSQQWYASHRLRNTVVAHVRQGY
jgi:hypothetical protein